MTITARNRQRGWAGLLSLLLALVIVGFAMRTVLKHMADDVAPPPGTAVAMPGAAGTRALEQARAVEVQLQRQGEEARRRIDSADQGGPPQ